METRGLKIWIHCTPLRLVMLMMLRSILPYIHFSTPVILSAVLTPPGRVTTWLVPVSSVRTIYCKTRACVGSRPNINVPKCGQLVSQQFSPSVFYSVATRSPSLDARSIRSFSCIVYRIVLSQRIPGCPLKCRILRLYLQCKEQMETINHRFYRVCVLPDIFVEYYENHGQWVYRK